MLRRAFSSSSVAAPTTAAFAPAAVPSLFATKRWTNGIGPEPVTPAHPDVKLGFHQMEYRGRGWSNLHKQLPQDQVVCEGGAGPTNMHDRMGHVQDPEDPRHPIIRIQVGEQKLFDGAVHTIVGGNYGPIRKGSRLLQLLYAHYLEPFSCNRVCVHLRHWDKVPDAHHMTLEASVEYVGQTASLIGNVLVAGGTCVMEGVTMRGDTNQVYVMEGAQILENCMLIADAPTTLHHYQRSEQTNPYQVWDATEGVVKICGNVVVEPNCMIEAAQIGTFTRIGHGTKIMKNAQIGSLCQILPGSVVLADQKIYDGEIWGGAPAVKLGKVSKFDYKKPYYYSCNHREMVLDGWDGASNYGDQVVLREQEMDKLDALMITYEKDLPAGLKRQLEEFIDGREPYGHTIARLTQGWSPKVMSDEKTMDGCIPMINPNAWRNHNDDAESEYSGTVMNWTKYCAEKRW